MKGLRLKKETKETSGMEGVKNSNLLFNFWNPFYVCYLIYQTYFLQPAYSPNLFSAYNFTFRFKSWICWRPKPCSIISPPQLLKNFFSQYFDRVESSKSSSRHCGKKSILIASSIVCLIDCFGVEKWTYTFFIRISKILMRLNILIFDLFMAKTTPDVNNSL